MVAAEALQRVLEALVPHGHRRRAPNLERAYQLFVEVFRDAAELLKSGHSDPRFPEGSFPPGRPFVPDLAPG